jgi:uncharacterized cupredoxin-like copper-binding protein
MKNRSWHRRAATFGVLVALTAFATACSDDPDAPSSGDGTTVDVALRDWAIEVDPDTVDAGGVTFRAENEGPTTHEFEVFSGDVASGSLPVSEGVADTAGLTLVDEVEDVFAGSTSELRLDMEAGVYLLICNLPDHYERGMSTTITVR